MSEEGPHHHVLDGASLTLGRLAAIARSAAAPVECDKAALDRVRRGRRQIDAIAGEYERQFARYRETGAEADRPSLTYGVTTGFGEFKRVPIAPDRLESLQQNILLSHAVGVGENADPNDPSNYAPPDVVRAAMTLRLNALLKGHSGVRTELVECIAAMISRGVVPLVPVKGSVGASGDLCPMAHLFGVLVGAGRFVVVESGESSPIRTQDARPASELRELLGDKLAEPTLKEGLALTNGTSMTTALLALAVHDACLVAGVADAAAAATLEALCGRARAFDPKVHEARGQVGQIDSAANIRAMIDGSGLIDRAAEVQDVYSLRCAPQVHGASRDAIAYAATIVSRELNAATDNPLFFPDDPPWDERFRSNRSTNSGDSAAYSAGNFHGQPIGIAADVLAIGLAELANISERRTQLLLDSHHNRNLPSNLIAQRGLNSGYMLTQYTAASLVSENKVLAHPASVDSIPTAANTEDHVAMSTWAARKARSVLANTQAVLAIELLVSAQALEWRLAMNRDPNAPAATAASFDDAALDAAAAEAAEFELATVATQRAQIAARLGRGTAAVYLAVRRVAEPLAADRPLEGDLRAVRRIVADGGLVADVQKAIDAGLRPLA